MSDQVMRETLRDRLYPVPEKQCECSPLARIAADNAGPVSEFVARLVKALDGICNGCGGSRP